MTLVLETSPDIHPESDNAIKQSLQTLGLSPAGKPVTFGNHSFHYYTIENPSNPAEVIESLMKHPAIKSAYFKPEGTPP